jgi:hypothetical protein
MKGGTPPPGGGPNKVATSRAERLFRLRVVEEAMVEGKRAAEVQEVLAAVGRVVPTRTVADYIRAVRLKWEEEDRIHRKSTRARQLRDLYQTAALMKKSRAWASWVATQKLIADLEGNVPERGQLPDETPAGDFDGWSQEELDSYIVSGGEAEPAWLKKAREAGGGANGRGNGHDDGDHGDGGMPSPRDILN